MGDGGDIYTGWDRFGRVIDVRWLKSATALERLKYGFDRAGNRLWRKNEVQTTGQDEHYTYDGLYQLAQLDRGTLDSGKTKIDGTPSWEEDCKHSSSTYRHFRVSPVKWLNGYQFRQERAARTAQPPGS
ncbi:MAG: hypothetical protein WD490_04780, partial [Opitutales bacterium]